MLTIATDQPAYEPWMVDDDPTNGEGFEAAVAYAVAEQLGYAEDVVTWTRVPFNAAIQPGPKAFDFDINQFTITEEAGEGGRLLLAVLHGGAGGRHDRHARRPPARPASPTSSRCGSVRRWRPRAWTRSTR